MFPIKIIGNCPEVNVKWFLPLKKSFRKWKGRLNILIKRLLLYRTNLKVLSCLYVLNIFSSNVGATTVTSTELSDNSFAKLYA